MSLEHIVKQFITMLETTEESDSGRVFHPTYISSCRVINSVKMSKLLADMKALSNYKEGEISIYDIKPEVSIRNL